MVAHKTRSTQVQVAKTKLSRLTSVAGLPGHDTISSMMVEITSTHEWFWLVRFQISEKKTKLEASAVIPHGCDNGNDAQLAGHQNSIQKKLLLDGMIR